MRRSVSSQACLVALAISSSCGSSPAGTQGTPDASAQGDGAPDADKPLEKPLNVLLFNYTAGFGHQSRVTSLPLLETAAAANNINLDVRYAFRYDGPGQTIPAEGTNDLGQPLDLSAFTPGGLDKYDVVFFLNTTGNVFQGADEQVHEQALQDYMEQHHGGFVGTHSATDTYDDGWPWYQDFIGAIVSGHSAGLPPGTARYNAGVNDNPILTTAMVPNPWARSEEWYTFMRDVRDLTNFTVLLLCDAPDRTGAMVERPSAWIHDVPGGGRVFYTAFGHAVDAFKEPAFMQLLMAGLAWAGHRID